MSTLPPLRKIGPLTAAEQKQLAELQRRANLPPSAEVIHLQNRNAERERQLRADELLRRYDARMADKISAICHSEDGSRFIKIGFNLEHVKLEVAPWVDRRALRRDLEAGAKRLRGLLVGWAEDGAEGDHDYWFNDEQKNLCWDCFLETCAAAFARNWKNQ